MHSSPTRFLLIRHGETIWNHDRRHAGQTEVALSPEAELPIRLLTKRLIQETIHYIYSSPLSRTIATISPTAEILDLPIKSDDRLLERALGDWEGKRPEDLLPSHPGYHFPSSAYTGDFRIPNAEPLDELEHRIRSFLHDTHQKHPGKCIAVSTHSGVIWTVQHRIVTNPPHATTWPENCSITTISTEGNHYLLESIEPGS